MSEEDKEKKKKSGLSTTSTDITFDPVFSFEIAANIFKKPKSKSKSSSSSKDKSSSGDSSSKPTKSLDPIVDFVTGMAELREASSASKACGSCGKKTPNKCTGCMTTFYCNKEHQEKEFKKHKDSCRPFKIVSSKEIGRHLVATKNLDQGEFIFEDKPLVRGPKQGTMALCLGCFKPVKGAYLCSLCNWPLCSGRCETSKYHLSECKVFGALRRKLMVHQFDTPCPMYDCVTPLRCILLKEKEKDKFDMLMSLESHDVERQGSEIWTVNQTNVVKYLKDVVRLAGTEEETIHTVCNILDVNAFEARGKDILKTRLLYPIACLCSHDCVPNTYHIIDQKTGVLTMRACKPIKKGDVIAVSYTSVLTGTTARRAALKDGKYFDCHCKRCQDPTEYGSYLNAMKCGMCKKGYVLPGHPLERDSRWRCNKCDYVNEAKVVKKIFDDAQKEIDNVDDEDIEKYEEMMKKYGEIFHANNYILVGIKHTLSRLYGYVSGYQIRSMSNSQLKRKEQLCNELLEVLSIVDPGISRIKGITQYELQGPVVILAGKEFASNKIKMKEYTARIKKAIKILDDCIKTLKYEPSESTGGRIVKLAEKTKKELEKGV